MTLRLVSDDGNSAELPLVLSVEEAARILRIGRSAAYEQARIFRATAGREGLPVIAIGRSLRVPRAALLDLLETGCPRNKDAS
ncbi:MAG TPA: helix-turn-helix domain-containing protein [Acidimicrobiales bacterium]|nr:helix-turn-helix domain-containing protein [Acidimicrobiales bacterium]